MKRWSGALACAAAAVLGSSAMADVGIFQGDQDLGRPGDDPKIAGGVVYDAGAGTYTVTAGGSDWWDGGEFGHFVYKQTPNDFRIEANLQVVGDPVDNWAKFGVAIRKNLDTGAGNEKRVNYFTAVTDPFRNDGSTADVGSGARAAFQGRNSDAENMFNVDQQGKQPNDGSFRVALQRNTLHGIPYISSYIDRGQGAGWQFLSGTFAPNLPDNAYVGLAVTAHHNDGTESAIFSNVQFTTTPPAATDPTDPANMPNARTVAAPAQVSNAWSIREVIANGDLHTTGNLNNAANSLNNIGGTAIVKNYTAPVINILDSGTDGHFTPNAPFGVVGVPGAPIAGSVEDLAMVASAKVVIPTDGIYTFGVNSDDGFELSVDGKVVASFDAGRGAADTLGSVALAAGVHNIKLLYWEGGGGSEVEVFGGKGLFGSYDASLKLVGDTANGGLALAVVPEPASMSLLALGALGLLARRRKH